MDESNIQYKDDYLKTIDLSHFSYQLQNNGKFKNTAEEETILEYVESFRRQFVQLFPHRPELILCPFNEFGVRKFVCSSIRPTLQQFTINWHMKQCAQFVADFLEYKPLKQPTQHVCHAS